MKRLVLVVGALVLVAGASTAGASSSVPTARSGRLAGTTTLSWTGTAGITLTVPKRALLTGADADLIVDGGTYAFVRIVGAPVKSCDPAIGPYCLSTMFSYLKGMHERPISGSRAKSHWTIAPDPAALDAPRVGVYLFTDGRATLTLRTNLTGRTAYRPTGRFRGRVTRLPQECQPVACASAPASSNSVTYGGASYDLGTRGGWAEMIGVSANRDSTETANQLHGIGGCLYPNPVDPTLSADPAAYPVGCGLVPPNSSQAYSSVIGEINGAPGPGANRGSVLYWTAAKGPQYIGYRAKSFGAVPARVDAYGIWFNLGIS